MKRRWPAGCRPPLAGHRLDRLLLPSACKSPPAELPSRRAQAPGEPSEVMRPAV